MSVPKIVAIIVVAVAVAGGAYYLGTSSGGDKNSPDTAQEETKKEGVDVAQVLAKVKQRFNTVDETKVYTETNDPNNSVGKPGKYQAGGAFRDKRARQSSDSLLSESPEPDWGTDEGGSIEVYENEVDAKRRVEYLKNFQEGFLDSGAVAQAGKVVIRASSYLTNSQQQELIAFIKGQL